MNTSMPLFIEPVRFEAEKTASLKLSDNFQKWDQEIIEHVHSEHPYLAKVPFEIFFKKKDKELGYAQGGIELKIGKEKIVVPIIVKKREMSPLDVLMIGEDKVVPLTEDAIISVIQQHGKMGKLEDRRKEGIVEKHIGLDAEGAQGMMPPNYGKYTYASIAERIPSALQKDMDFFREVLEKTAEYQAGFIYNDTVSPLSRIAKIPTVKSIEKQASRQRVYGKQLDEINLDFQHLTKTAGAIVVDRVHGAHQGLFIDSVESFEGEKLSHSLFVGNDNHWAYQEKIAGKVKPVDMKVEKDFSIGDDICFTKVANGKLIALEPIQILAKTNDCGNIKIAARTHMGTLFKATLVDKVASVQRTNTGYLIPSDYGVIKLGKRIAAMEDDDVLQKLAMVKISPNLSYLKCVGRNFEFDNEKVGAFHGVYEKEAIAKLSGYYTNAEELVKLAYKKGKVIISGISDTEKISSVKVPTDIKLEWTDRVKLASALSSPDSVDAILSLGFVNEETLQNFIEMIPDFEKAVVSLSRLLVAIRLGVKGDENATKMALKYLQRVIDSLKGIGG